ncbi:proteasome assembly chaperone family protein [Haloplanus rubicundus]|uniref:Proteasome assembly chaperone family protein n=1 Tax=Haloplanus rubicundus TaxID=1547898 RepID=A0A345E649_9EURY|nr:PAC2 family protein [Haloplanus rubicundus]AXG07671.1 proteasome assembly chaperone family protein [Haloplanus rubicundus]AXG11089.1 proteasome assembly chaperone family protein [Haloplanus rubicundus]
MSTNPGRDPTFHISNDASPSTTVVAGFSAFGLAGLTAVDFLVDHLELEETGHLTAEYLPSITPFEAGRPRHHSRFFSRPDLDLTVFVNELFLPTPVADSFADTLLSWTDEHDVAEILVLSGIPYAHGPDEHDTFYVASDDYRERRLADADIRPMGRGFLDGINGSLMYRGIESDLRTALFITPVHAQVPDVPAAIRLVETFDRVYDFGIDAGPLEEFARTVEQYYQDLAARLETVANKQMPEDRMYM